MDAAEKRRIIEKRIIRELTQYFEQHKTGIPMQILSAKYAKASTEIGGFPELIEHLRVIGIVRVEYSSNGARTVSIQTTEVEWF